MDTAARPGGESRRSFLGRVGSVTAGACFGALPWVSGCASIPYASPLREAGAFRLPLDVFETTPGVLIDFPEEGMPIYVHRHGPERFTAVLTRCSHRGCEAEPNGERIVCPCHGSEYTTAGQVLQGPAEEALTAYGVQVEDGFVRIDVREPGAGR
jgi:cytochrome b6-f complex iron-sulfur subunit